MHYPFSRTVEGFDKQKKHGWHLWAESSDAKSVLEDLLAPQKIHESTILKQEKRKLVFTGGPSNRLVIKWQRYRDPRRLWKANYFRNQRLTRNEGGMLRTEWMNNCFLYDKGISVAKPIGFAELRVAGVILDQALICENLKDAPRLKDYVDNLDSLDEKKTWLERGIQLAYELHEQGCYHLDFHHRNILFVGDEPHLIDNEKLVFFEEPRDDLLAMMLGRLGFSLRDNPIEHAFYKNFARPTKNLTLFEKAFDGKLSGKLLSRLISLN